MKTIEGKIPKEVISQIVDLAKKDRRDLIARTEDWKSTAEILSAKVMRLHEANTRAIHLLEAGLPEKAKAALLEATMD